MNHLVPEPCMLEPEHHLLYTSVCVKPMSDAQLMRMVLCARMANSSMGITGLLIYNKGTFFQIIEGEQKVVEDLYAKICLDPRHTEIVKVAQRPIKCRAFPSWSMGLISESGIFRMY